MLIAVVTVFLLSFKRARKNNISIDDMFIIGASSLSIGLIFANFLNVMVSYPISTIINSILKGNFEIFGGLVFYGGLIGGILGGILGIKIAGVKTAIIENSVVPYLPIGHAIGRIGCVMAGCCNGMEYQGPFAIYYSNSIANLPVEQGYFPIQVLEAILNIIISACLINYSKKERITYSLLFLYLLLYSIVRFSLEFLRGDLIRGIYYGLSTSQWISIILFATSLIYFLLLIKKNSNHLKQTVIT